MHHTSDRVLPTGRGEAVNNKIDLAHVRLDHVDRLLLDLITERIAIDTLGI